MNTARVEVFVRHDSPLVCAGLAATLQEQSDFAVTVSSADRPAADPSRFDVFIADYASGLQYLEEVAQSRQTGARPSIPKLLIVTNKAGEWDIRCAMSRGVPGYLLLGCPAERLLHAVRSLARGGRCYDDVVTARIADSLVHATLTKREHDVLHLMSQGVGNKHIARTLDIQVGTVKTHVKAILDKLEVRTRTQAVVVAEHRGLIRAIAE
jgi:two-component system NarL family response regulator